MQRRILNSSANNYGGAGENVCGIGIKEVPLTFFIGGGVVRALGLEGMWPSHFGGGGAMANHLAPDPFGTMLR